MLFYEVSKPSLTLVELIIVIVIVGILLTFAVPAFINTQLKIKDNEVRANLKILQAAVKNFGIDNEGYGPPAETCNTTAACNTLYNSDLPPGEWNYWIRVYAAGDFCVNADKVNDNTESWHIWEFNATAQDCRCGGGRCTNR